MSVVEHVRAFLRVSRTRMMVFLCLSVTLQVVSVSAIRYWVRHTPGASQGWGEVIANLVGFAWLVVYFWIAKSSWSGATQPLLQEQSIKEVVGHTRISRLFLAGDRYSAWLYRSESRIMQRDIDRLDWLVGSRRGQAIIGLWVLAFLAVGALLSGVQVNDLKVGIGWHLPGPDALVTVTFACLFFAIVFGWLAVDVWIGFRKYAGKMRRFAVVNLLVIMAALSAVMLSALIGGVNSHRLMVAGLGGVVGGLAAMLLIGGIVAIVSFMRNREFKFEHGRLLAEAAQAQAEATQAKVGRELAEAQLKLLQAQIEPHFLFNTLASLQHRAEGKAPEAAALAADLIRFLRGSMDALRTERVALGRDADMVAAYLGVMQARLGSRLQFEMSVPAELAQQPVPTMMLLTLVENALKHGIEPHPPGGMVRVTARTVGGELWLTVADTGRGVSDIPGSGVGLENIRSRLRLLYGPAARLMLEENEPQGFVATLVLP